MRAKFTQTDSEGNPTHTKIVRTVDGERAEMKIASTGTIQGPKNVIQALIDDPGSSVEPLDSDESDSDDDSDDSGGEADSDDTGEDTDDEDE